MATFRWKGRQLKGAMAIQAAMFTIKTRRDATQFVKAYDQFLGYASPDTSYVEGSAGRRNALALVDHLVATDEEKDRLRRLFK